MDEVLIKIGELADFSGISTKALRVYEKMELIKPVKVDEETGYRYYSPDQVKDVEALLEWKDMGFSLKEIQNLDFNVFLLYPKIRIHSENRSFPYCKCVLQ